MKKDIKIGSIEHNAYMDLFAFHRNYGTPEIDNEKYWDDMVDAAGLVDRKYRGTYMEPMVTNFMVALMGALDAEARRMRDGKN